MERGFIKLYRKIADNPLWHTKPFSDGQAWVDLLIIANHKKGVIDKRGNRVIVERGQVGYSILGLADRWGWSRGKVDRFLKHLENEQQIEQQKSSITTLITLLNYNKYTDTDSRTDSRRTTDGQQTNTNKKGKNEKKLYGIGENIPLTDSQYSKLVDKLSEEITLEYIDKVSTWNKVKTVKDHYLTILNWWKRAGEPKPKEISIDSKAEDNRIKQEHAMQQRRDMGII